jgi:hypothetical protein
MVVANNLVKVKLIPILDPILKGKNPYYVVKIIVEKGWFENYYIFYHINGDYFFRTENEVKCYKQPDKLDIIKKWRIYKTM